MIDLHQLDCYRLMTREVLDYFGSTGDGTAGMFHIPSRIDGQTLRCMASSADGWDHVSVSRERRCPTWAEMEQVKRMFFRPSEIAMQLHVPPADHISMHPYCLHIWRPTEFMIPMPPSWMVA